MADFITNSAILLYLLVSLSFVLASFFGALLAFGAWSGIWRRTKTTQSFYQTGKACQRLANQSYFAGDFPTAMILYGQAAELYERAWRTNEQTWRIEESLEVNRAEYALSAAGAWLCMDWIEPNPKAIIQAQTIILAQLERSKEKEKDLRATLRDCARREQRSRRGLQPKQEENFSE